jgi:hypothetical protein
MNFNLYLFANVVVWLVIYSGGSFMLDRYMVRHYASTTHGEGYIVMGIVAVVGFCFTVMLSLNYFCRMSPINCTL